MMKAVIDWIRNIDMRWVMGVIGIMVLIEQSIIGGHTPLSDPGSPVPPAVLAKIVWWCSFAMWLNGFILVGHAGTAATWVTSSPTATKTIAILAILLAATVAAHAQTAPKPKPIPTNCLTVDPRPECQNGIFAPGQPGGQVQLTGNVSKDLQALWLKIIALSNADLKYASALAGSANTNSSMVRKQCFDAILALNQQANGANLKDASGNPMPKPDPSLFTDVEQLAEVVDNLSPQGPLFTSCAGAAQLARTSTLQFISAVVAGVAGVTAIAPIIP